MSTLRTDNIQTTDSLVTVAVSTIAQTSQVVSNADLASQSDAAKGAALVGYRQRTVHDKFKEDLPSIFDYMTDAERADARLASPVLDHTLAVQSAFADIGVNIWKLEITDGANFRVNDTSTITSKSGFRIFGKGQIRQFTANKRILVLTSCTDFEIKGSRFYGLGTDFTPLVDTGIGDAIYANLCSDFSITKCKFTNFGSAAVRTKDGNDFHVDDNEIIGTHGITSAIAPNDLYQFGVVCQSNWPSNTGPVKFSVDRNKVRNVAIGIRVEPKARDYSCIGNYVEDVKGNHAFYLNGQDFTVSNNRCRRIQLVGIKCQSFYNASGPSTDPIANVVISGNNINGCESGIHVEKNDTNALKSSYVTISGNRVRGALATGSGILAQDVDQLEIIGNGCKDGFYGIIANQFGATTAACSGKIIGNILTDSVGPAILVNTDYLMDVSDNTAIRPCLGVAATPGDTAFYLTGTTTGKRIRAEGNTVYVDTSTGVSHGLRILSVQAGLGNNDLDGKLLDTTGSTLRQRGVSTSFAGRQTWGSGPTIAAGASATIAITVTGANASDIVAYVNHASDLQGCILSADVQTNVLNVTITNGTGSSKTIADGFVRWGIMKFDN